MTILEENFKKYYQSGYNCSETLLHACNETYQLDISEEDMKMMAGFGGGMFISGKSSRKNNGGRTPIIGFFLFSYIRNNLSTR